MALDTPRIAVNQLSLLLGVFAVGLVAIAIVAVLVGEMLFAGLCLLGLTFTIYLRETRT